MVDINPAVSRIPLNINGLSALINYKTEIVEGIKKQDPTIHCLQKIHISAKPHRE